MAAMIATTMPRVTANFVELVMGPGGDDVWVGKLAVIVDIIEVEDEIAADTLAVTTGKLPGAGACGGGSTTLIPQIVRVADPFMAVCNISRE